MSPLGVDIPFDPVDRSKVYTLNFFNSPSTAAFKKVLLDAVLAGVG